MSFIWSLSCSAKVGRAAGFALQDERLDNRARFSILADVKGKALILMVCLLAYLAGWTAVPRLVQAAAHQDCCAKMALAGAHGCPKEGKGEKGCAEKGCAGECLSCPMCYTMIIPVKNPEEPLVLVVKFEYADWQSADLCGYRSDAWKPPNQA
jgi:hypothetical protein